MINVTPNKNEMVITGEVVAGDIYPDLCCAGHNWTVVLILASAWGQCSNPDCTAGVEPGSDDGYYRGVSHYCVEFIAEKLLDGQTPCPECEGTGHYPECNFICEWCGGTGRRNEVTQ